MPQRLHCFLPDNMKKCLIHAPLWERKDNKLLGKMFSEKVFTKRDLYIPHGAHMTTIGDSPSTSEQLP